MEPTSHYDLVMRLLPDKAKDWAVWSDIEREGKLGYLPCQSAQFVCDKAGIPYPEPLAAELEKRKRML